MHRNYTIHRSFALYIEIIPHTKKLHTLHRNNALYIESKHFTLTKQTFYVNLYSVANKPTYLPTYLYI